MRERALETCLVLAGASLIFLELITPKHPIGIYLSLLFIVIGVFVKPAAQLIHKAWMTISEYAGSIISKIVLTVFYLGFFTPLALLKRILSRSDPLILSPPENSVFKDRNHNFSPQDFERQF